MVLLVAGSCKLLNTAAQRGNKKKNRRAGGQSDPAGEAFVGEMRPRWLRRLTSLGRRCLLPCLSVWAWRAPTSSRLRARMAG